ncbi:hypothetical protein J3458_002066 [Metarhizium acridum]|uniref:uncharacterized protein n=1 Tax=Metarhizium acridum TaxID=92637 RepID=UPI001C6B2494|nr:hypothetical protein J3458_002066 [Metarhizium acridum]
MSATRTSRIWHTLAWLVLLLGLLSSRDRSRCGELAEARDAVGGGCSKTTSPDMPGWTEGVRFVESVPSLSARYTVQPWCYGDAQKERVMYERRSAPYGVLKTTCIRGSDVRTGRTSPDRCALVVALSHLGHLEVYGTACVVFL